MLLRDLRQWAGMSQERLAERSGVDVGTILGFETGERVVTRATTVRLLADALELELDEREELLAVGGKAQREASTHDQTRIMPGSTVQIKAAGGAALQNTLAHAADQLAFAVLARWRREEEQRRIQDPFPLPVRWQLAPEHLTDHWANIRRAPAGDMSGPLDLTGQLDQVADVYRRIPSGRLVVLGRAGSGKTVLAVRFVLDLLTRRNRIDPVPVVFSLGSWRPDAILLRDWLIGQLVRDYPGLAAAGPVGSTVAAALIESGRILPVLDGFDEIAVGLRGVALEALNATPMPLLLTSRPDEYATAVAEVDVLVSAASIELTDLTVADLADYLPRTTRKTTSGGGVWDPVLNELREHPESSASVNLATVLTTPLMVMLARTVYSDGPGRDPAILLDTDRFATAAAVEEHLLDYFVPMVDRHHLDDRSARRRPPRDPDRDQRWLSYLAQHLHQLKTRDLAWWQLGSGTTRRSSRMPAVGLLSGLAFGLVGGLLAGIGPMAGLVTALACGLAFGLARAVADRSGAVALEPSRLRIRAVGRMARIRRRIVPRLIVGLAGGLGAGLVLGPGAEFVPGFESVAGLGYGLLGGLVNGVGLGLVGGLVWGLMAALEVPIDISVSGSPSDLLNSSRRTAIVQFLTWGLVLGLIQGLVIGLGQEPRAGLVDGLVVGLVLGSAGGLSLTAWGQWLAVSRIWLPLAGRLPWAVIAFLDDACRRGVLRQVGGVYQFRHARLQDHFARIAQSGRTSADSWLSAQRVGEKTPRSADAFDPADPMAILANLDGVDSRAAIVDTGTVPLVLYLSDASQAPQVEQALENALAAFDGEVDHRESPIIRSWFRRMRIRFRDADGPEAVRRWGRELDRAVELRAVDEVQARVDATQSKAVAELLTALADTPAALIQLGSVLLIKVDGVPIVRNLTQAELNYLQRNPNLLRDPIACLDALQKAADRGVADDNTGRATHRAALAGGSPSSATGLPESYGTAAE
ncbi:helix-turn-helix domain-containing protein [Actinocrispum wychmicini]|uniref:NACHT domain-containing protein n=1 Tax=Actinocrispum wychmicini TaxID=1213861 RepID=A0A4R2IIY0_9PSEU|nr:NACHT domain-containing protein [Actinocrispum wychmicini]